MVTMNIFRILGDVSHTVSKCILIWAIHSNRSAEGISLITQILYVAVFCTRYVDLFWTKPTDNLWNFVLKNFYIISSFYIIFVMMRVYARTREREKAWKLGGICLGGATITAPLVTLIYWKWSGTTLFEVLISFALILESVCVLPQLILLRQTTVPTVIDSFYLLTLGSYRAFYILNWIYRGVYDTNKPDLRSVIFGIVQTAFYIDFAWVYWTRQRVKLRNGGVVDSDDLSRGWLLNRLLGRPGGGMDAEEGNAIGDNAGDDSRPSGRRKWGARGVSVSADDDEAEPWRTPKANTPGENSKMKHDDFDDILEDEENSDVDADGLTNNRTKTVKNGTLDEQRRP